jgi:putative transposase
VWAYDFVHDRCANGQALKCLGIVDEYTRECLALEPDTRIDARRVIEILERTMEQYGTPQYLRSDQGPEFVAQAVRTWLADKEVNTAYIEPGKPWQNGVNESFFDKLRDECLNREEFAHLREARVLLRLYRRHYNEHRPHSSLGCQTPQEVAARERGKLPSLTFALAL